MTEKFPIPTYGLELEKVFTGLDGTPHCVGDAYFIGLQARAQNRGEQASLKDTNHVLVGVENERGVESLDNSFFLGESSTRPVTAKEGGLNVLSLLVKSQIDDVAGVLADEGAGLLNMANHPLISLSAKNYKRHVVPKPVYDYMRNVRMWDHKVGINAKAQNSPSTGVTTEIASEALNGIIGMGGVFVGLFGNSPFEQAAKTPYKESRLMMWSDMFKHATFGSDLALSRMPAKPFTGLAHYFNWMFGKDTAMYFLVNARDDHLPNNEKGDVKFTRILGDPPMLEFMKGRSWVGTDTESGEEYTVSPSIGHFAMNQFTHFSAARIRYGLKDDVDVDPGLVAATIASGDKPTESLFHDICDFFYIEGRDPGANLPDAYLRGMGDVIAESVVMSPSALQAGLIANLDATTRYWHSLGWDTLRGLRDAAIKDGLQGRYNGHKVREVAAKAISIASEGLDPSEQWMLEYPQFVLESGENGAERAIRRFDELPGNDAKKIARISKERVAAL